MNPFRTLLLRSWNLLTYPPFLLNRFLRFLWAKTHSYLFGSPRDGADTRRSQETSPNFIRKVMSQGLCAVMCHRCGDLIPSRTFERHVAEEHGAPAGSCVWCDQIEGTRGEKLDDIPLNPDILTPHQDLLLPPPDQSLPLFRNEFLDLARKCLLLFLDPRETHGWYHLTVTRGAYPSFHKAQEEDEGHTRTLDFSCWCDAGPHPKAEQRQHRHLIVVSPADHFERHVWPKVASSYASDAAYACKSLQRIASPMQLVELFGSLTGRASTCETGPWQEGNEHHFALYMTLPEHYKLSLALLWDGGLQLFLDAETFRDADLARVMERPLRFVDGAWRQRIGDFYHLQKKMVLPVFQNLKPTRERGPEDPLHTFHLLEGKKVYFYYSREMGSLGTEEWLRAQADGGNAFFENIGEALWTPSDQETLSRLMPEAEGAEEPAKEGTMEAEKKNE